jgi:hypothetical protein
MSKKKILFTEDQHNLQEDNQEEKSPVVSEKEILKEEKERKVKQAVDQEEVEIKEKYYNRAGKVRINFESNGRFGNPPIAYYEDYSLKHINDITLSRTEDLLENIITILNEIRQPEEETPFCHSELLLEEFLEVLIGIKYQFIGRDHTHRWICDCQRMLDPNDQVVNETIIDLSTLVYRSVEEAEVNLKKYVKNRLKDFTKSEFHQYLINKYKNDPVNLDEWDLEKEINSIKIEEPMTLLIGEDRYSFRFSRLKDIIKAQKITQKEFNGKIKAAQSVRFKEGTSLADYKAKKNKEIEDLKYEQAKAGIFYAKALCLESINSERLSDQQKIEKYSKIPRNVIDNFIALLNEIKFGIYHEQELICPECGETSERSLQQEFNPLEFLPMESATAGERSKSKEFNIFIGV